MRLGTLLAAGKSLALGRRGENPYRANKRIYLPKFDSPKGPLSVTAETKTAASAVEDADAAPRKKEVAAKTQKLPALSFATKNQMTAAEKPRRSSKWMGKLNPFVSRPAFPAPRGNKAKVPVQTELSLETVKVLRNDLSDADVEVVPLKSHPPADATGPGPDPAKRSWGLLGERLLKMKTG